MILPEDEQLPQLSDYIRESWVDMRISEPDPITSLIERIALK